MPKPKCTQAQVLAALEETKGGIFLAAKRLGVSRRTVTRYLDRYEKVRDAIADARGELVDIGELKLRQRVQDGHWPAIRFLLITQGKDRGYNEGKEMKHSGGLDLNIEISEERRRSLTAAALAEFGISLSGDVEPGAGDPNPRAVG